MGAGLFTQNGLSLGNTDPPSLLAYRPAGFFARETELSQVFEPPFFAKSRASFCGGTSGFAFPPTSAPGSIARVGRRLTLRGNSLRLANRRRTLVHPGKLFPAPLSFTMAHLPGDRQPSCLPHSRQKKSCLSPSGGPWKKHRWPMQLWVGQPVEGDVGKAP